MLSYFDGRSARAQAAEIWLGPERGELLVQAAELRRYAVGQVRWPERQRYGERQVLLPDGGVLSTADSAAWNAWAAASGLQDSPTVRWMQSWRHVGLSLLLLVALLAAGWRWGVPLAADGLLALLPAAAEARIGEQALAQFDRYLLSASKLSFAQQNAVRQRFAKALAAAARRTAGRCDERRRGR